jgi:YesN/AraC family two-component response regulator
MKSLEVESRSPNPVDLPYLKSQRIITDVRHRIAVQKALAMIDERIQDPPTLADLASCSGLSRTYFSVIFKEVTGIRLQDYLMQIRLDKAKTLLCCIDLKVKQIAFETGYPDPNYFCRTFKKKTGLNPTSWRLRKSLEKKDLLIGDELGNQP